MLMDTQIATIDHVIASATAGLDDAAAAKCCRDLAAAPIAAFGDELDTRDERVLLGASDRALAAAKAFEAALSGDDVARRAVETNPTAVAAWLRRQYEGKGGSAPGLYQACVAWTRLEAGENTCADGTQIAHYVRGAINALSEAEGPIPSPFAKTPGHEYLRGSAVPPSAFRRAAAAEQRLWEDLTRAVARAPTTSPASASSEK